MTLFETVIFFLEKFLFVLSIIGIIVIIDVVLVAIGLIEPPKRRD